MFAFRNTVVQGFWAVSTAGNCILLELTPNQMSTADTEKFLDDLKASGVAPTSAVDQWRAIANNPNDPRKLADLLVAQGNLTPWQAKYLLSGRHRLRFGNYVLIDRGNHTQLGDAFIGRHEQLDRLVNILFLTKDVSSRLAQNRSLIQRLAAAGDVDHLNLEHVHLIDQESDRYMLVTDHHTGNSLNDAELLVSLTPADLPGILRQALQAVDHIRKAGFSYGDLTERNLVLDSSLKLTVTNLVESILVNQLDGNCGDATGRAKDDIQAITLIGRRLIARLASHDKGDTTNRVQVITDRLARSEYDLADAIDALKAIENLVGKPVMGKIELPLSPAAANSTAKTAAGPSAKDMTGKSSNKIITVGNSGTLLRNALTVSAAVIVATIAVLIISRIWLGGESDSNSAAQRTEADGGTNELPSRPRVFSEPASVATGRQSPGTATNPAVAANQSRNVSEPDESGMEGSQLDLTAIPGETDRPILPNPADPSMADVPISKTESDRPAEESELIGARSILSAYQSADSDVVSPLNESSKRSGDPQAQDDDEAVESIPAADELNPPSTNGPPGSGGLPESVDLPPDSNTEIRRLFAIEAIQGTLTLELVTDKNISRSSIEFDMSEGQESEWTVQMFEPGNSNKSSVANFSLKNGALEFNWLDGAPEQSNANYLRNCVLRLRWDNGTRAIALRKPIIVDGFRLDRQEPQIRLDIPELEYLPKNAVVELLELDEEIYGTTFLLPEERTDRLFSGKNGLEIHFSDLPEFQLAYVILSSELRNRARLEATLLLRLIPDQKSRMATTATLEAAGNQLEEYFQTVKINHDGLKGMKIDELRRQFNLSSDQFKNEHKLAKVKELKQEMEFSEKRAKSFRELRTRLEAFYERSIPIAIFHDVDGHRVTLATTSTE